MKPKRMRVVSLQYCEKTNQARITLPIRLVEILNWEPYDKLRVYINDEELSIANLSERQRKQDALVEAERQQLGL